MRITSLVLPLAALVILGGLLACGGSYTAPAATSDGAVTSSPATSLVYTDPAGSGWRLVRNASSTAKFLVLDLVGPTGGQARGVGFNLSSDGSVAFHKFHDVTTVPGTYVKDMYLKDTGVFQLKYKDSRYQTDLTWMYEPVVIVGGIKNAGKLLTVGVWQKDRAQDAQAVDRPVLQIAIDLPATGGPAAGAAIPLTLVRARTIPAFIGDYPTDPNNVDWSSVFNNFRMDDIQIAVGSLHAQ